LIILNARIARAGVVVRKRAAARLAMARHLLVFSLVMLAVSVSTSAFANVDAQPSVAFYYGNDVPVQMLNQFDWAVVESEHVSNKELTSLEQHGTTAFAYVSLGEAEHWRGADAVPQAALKARNENWNSQAADLTRAEWGDYIVNDRIRPLWQAGYRALFLDTLDSYRLFATDDASAQQQQDALVALIRRIRSEFPGIKLLLNRGFEVLDRVQGDIVGVAAESLYKSYDARTQSYRDVSAEDSQYVLNQLQRVRDDYGLPAIAIDYVAPGDRDVARETARRIADAGIVPWVTNGAINQVGVGSIEPMPRKVLVLYNDAETDYGNFGYASAHLYAAMPLEYLGYGAVYQNVNDPLPSATLTGRYAGVVSWFNGAIADASGDYHAWLLRQFDDGMKVAMLGDPGIPVAGDLADRMGVQTLPASDPRRVTMVETSDDLVGFEGMPDRMAWVPLGYSIVGDARSHLSVVDPEGQRYNTVITGDWGGVALTPWVLQEGIGEQVRWILDPFAFLQQTLDLPAMPIPDPTTENGSRYWLTEIDGDAFVSRTAFPGNPFTGEVMLEQILRRYQVPTTVSIIEGEIAPDGVHPELTSRLEPLAREIFKLPWVEIASHTYSHPFEWQSLKEGELTAQGQTAAGYAYNMTIDGYRFSINKEVSGSVDYINDNLAPPNKQVTSILWSGDALPQAEALAIADRLGIANINGGNTHATDDNSSLTNVSAMLRPIGGHLQVYSPQTNENVYTNFMREPLWGFRRVIETYQITDRPRRLKPIDIYFHFYSASQPASLNALKDVFDYVARQETLPLYASTYSRVAQNWYDVGVARRLGGGWQITGATQTRTLRLPEAMGWPAIARSDGVAGVRDLPQGRYVALSGAPRVTLATQGSEPATPYVRRSNGRITSWRQSGDETTVELRAEVVSLEVELGGVSGCRVNAQGARRSGGGNSMTLRYQGSTSGPVRIDCGR